VSTAGRVHALVLVLVLALCVVGAIVFLVREEPLRTEANPPGPAASQDPAPLAGPPRVPSPSAEREAEPPGSSGAADVGNAPGSPDSRGIVRGEVVVREGASMPPRWTLVLEPHPWLQGHDSVVTRRREFEKGETSFEERDLPLGGYLARAEAASMNCLPASVLLVRDSSEAFVTLLLAPGGFIDGGVLDFEGRPAEGLDVTLESVETRQRTSLSTDPAGTYLFRDVTDGEYTLTFGRPESPLLPAESLAFKAPSLRFPTRSLPPTGTLKVQVIDESLRPLARVHISGSAPRATALDTFSDHLGLAVVRYLLPGRYRIDAQGEAGLEASSAVELDAGREVPLEMLLRRRKRSD